MNQTEAQRWLEANGHKIVERSLGLRQRVGLRFVEIHPKCIIVHCPEGKRHRFKDEFEAVAYFQAIQNPAHREAQPAAEKGRADGSEAFPGLFDAFD